MKQVKETAINHNYRVDVIGKLWMGGKGTKSNLTFRGSTDTYIFEKIESDGDFQEVIDWRVEKELFCHKCPDHVHTYWVLVRDWVSPDSESFFNDVNFPEESAP